MPFNYPELLPLAEDLLNHRLRPPNAWRQRFNEYISTVPSYYAQPLRKAFEMIGAPSNIIAESFDGQMSYSVTNYFRKLKKQAKLEGERILGTISKTIMNETCRRLEANGIVDLGNGMSLAIGSTLKDEETTSRSFRNPFDITRSGLLGQLARMRTNFLHSTPTTPNLIEEVVRHQVPIGQMGNYQEYLKKMNPLRELDELGGLRTQLFGNPYKLERTPDKAGGKLAESADMDIFADEHMVEMNRKPIARVGGARKRIRLRSPSPYPSRNGTPATPTSTPTSTGDGQGERAAEKKPPNKDSSLPATKEAQNSVSNANQQMPEETKEVRMSASHAGPEPFKSSSLPEEKSGNSATSSPKAAPLIKVNPSRKRERTPSPTPYPNPKRSLVTSDGLPSSKLTSALQILRDVSGDGNHVKSPAPVSSVGGALSRVTSPQRLVF